MYRENVEGRELVHGLAVDVDALGFCVVELKRLKT